MQRVIIVDVGNLRENRPGRAIHEYRTIDGRAKTTTMADWNYIDECILYLSAKAPASAIYLISDKSLRHYFVDRKAGMKKFDANRNLPCDEFWHMYAMPSRKEVAYWRGDENLKQGVEADELILYLAAALDGFVISGDFFRNPQYKKYLDAFGHRVYWPAKTLDDSDWHFVKSSEIQEYKFGRHERMISLTQLHTAMDDLPQLSAAEIRGIRESICETGGLIDRFWLEYRSEYEREHGVLGIAAQVSETQAPEPASVGYSDDFSTFDELSFTIDAEEAPAVEVYPKIKRAKSPAYRKPKPATRTSPTRSFIDVVKEQVGLSPPSDDGVDEEITISLVLACHLVQMSNSIGTTVRLVGRLRDTNGDTYLEWYPGDKRVRLTRQIQQSGLASGGFVGVIGRLHGNNQKFELDNARSQIVHTYPFNDIINLLSDDITGAQNIAPRRWHLPRLPRKSKTLPSTSPTPLSSPLPQPKSPPPGRAVTTIRPKVPTTTSGYLPPMPVAPRVNLRLITAMALSASIIAIAIALVVSLL